LAVTRIDDAIAGAGVRPQIMVFDDVLNSGKHIKVAQQLLLQRFPAASIVGVFLARCVPDPLWSLSRCLTNFEAEASLGR
jgi:hypoxanthine-guanine phosphoribosyltransferase